MANERKTISKFTDKLYAKYLKQVKKYGTLTDSLLEEMKKEVADFEDKKSKLDIDASEVLDNVKKDLEKYITKNDLKENESLIKIVEENKAAKERLSELKIQQKEAKLNAKYNKKVESIKNKKKFAGIKKIRNGVLVTTAAAVVIVAGSKVLPGAFEFGKGLFANDKEIEKEIETGKFDINNIDSVVKQVENLYKELAARGVDTTQFTTTDVLDYIMFKNQDSIDAEKLQELYSSKRTSADISNGYNKIVNLLIVDTITVQNTNDYVVLGNYTVSENDRDAISFVQLHAALLNKNIITKNTELVKQEELILKEFFINNYGVKGNNLSAAANLEILKLYVGIYRISANVMDETYIINAYGTANCDLENTKGSIYDTYYRESNEKMEQKYAIMSQIALANETESKYDATIIAINALTANVVTVKNAMTLEEMQNLAKTGSTEIGTKTTTTVTTKSTTTTGTKTPTTPQEGAKDALTHKEVIATSEIINVANESAIADAKKDGEFLTGDASYYKNKSLNARYTYNVENIYNNDKEALATYKKYYDQYYKSEMINNLKTSGKSAGASQANIDLKNNKTTSITDIVKDILSVRPHLLENKEYFAAVEAGVKEGYKAQLEILKAALERDKNATLTVTAPIGEKEIIVTEEKTIIKTPTESVIVTVPGEVVYYFLTPDLDINKIITLEQAKAQGIEVVYEDVNGKATEVYVKTRTK